MINFIRYLLFLPLYVSNKLLVIYSKLVCKIDPNGFECKLEELYQKQINLKTNKKLNNKILDYKPLLISKKKEIIFYTPTKSTNYRANSLFIKEKETIQWIDQYGAGNYVFFDIGANIGVYSLYYAMLHKSKVFAFEPQYQNNYILEKNIQINKLENFISVIPNPVYNKSKLEFLYSGQDNVPGSSDTTFIEKSEIKASKKKKKSTLSFSLDFLVKNFLIPKPNLIKIDVDGNEHAVIEGAIKTINSSSCKSILIETFSKTEKYTKKILEKNFYLHNVSRANKIYIRKK